MTAQTVALLMGDRAFDSAKTLSAFALGLREIHLSALD